jgi:hypothetical protein
MSHHLASPITHTGSRRRRRLEVVAPAITADEPAFEPLWDAIGKRRQVSFPYQRADETAPTTRRVAAATKASVADRPGNSHHA